MLTEVSIKGFKSYGPAQALDLSSMTVLIGANASGKSNAIEAIRFLSWLAQGQRLSSIEYQVNTSDAIVRGVSVDLAHRGSSRFTLGCRLDSGPWRDFSITLEWRDDGFHIVKEAVSSRSETVPLYEIVQSSNGQATDAWVAYNNFARGGKKPQIVVTDQHAVFTQLTKPTAIDPNRVRSRREVPAAAAALESALSRVLFLDPVPARMRGYSFPSERRLVGDGSNISAVLYNLCTNGTGHPSAKMAVLDFIRSLPEQSISDIDFLEEPRGGQLLELVETFGSGEHRYDASLLSDGTLRVLAIAAAMLSAEEGSLVVIEEIDNGVHPSRARDLLANIQRIASERGLRVLLSTHNPALLDALPLDAVPQVVFCYRDPDDGDSRLITLDELDSYPELVARGPLGRLLTAGDIDRAAKRLNPQRPTAKSWLGRRIGAAS